MRQTHEVTNQSPPLENYNLFDTDLALVEAAKREGGGWGEPVLRELGESYGRGEIQRLGFAANENPPVLKTHDRFGHRIDEVEFHPAWHELMRISVRYGLHSLPWREKRPGAHVVRAALMAMSSQNEFGHLCPISMTYSAVPALRKQPDVCREWEPRILSTDYDPAFRPAHEKRGALFGMAMTEKQGGSDVRANTTRAVRGTGGEYRLTGHKWFCSAPMSDAFLVLAQAPEGLSCFLVPRWTPDGARNAFFIQRLKDKLGNRSNASSEIELDGAWGRLIGEEGRGVQTILEMVTHTRLDCIIGSTGLMRQALAQALHHCTYRAAFGKKLVDQPLMRNVLADLALESEAATSLMMRVARSFDRRDEDPAERAFQRIATAIAKFWVCKRAVPFVGEALECLGGNGFVEESILPRLYRESPLNSLWEGAGNIMCLDVLRAMKREPETMAALRAELAPVKGANKDFDTFIAAFEKDLKACGEDEGMARRLVEKLALALQGTLLLRHGRAVEAEAFCASRLRGDWGCTFGTLPAGVDTSAILERARA